MRLSWLQPIIPAPFAVTTEIENYLAVRDTLLKNYYVPYLLIGNLREKLQQDSVTPLAILWGLNFDT
jgi:hypothetical protein